MLQHQPDHKRIVQRPIGFVLFGLGMAVMLGLDLAGVYAIGSKNPQLVRLGFGAAAAVFLGVALGTWRTIERVGQHIVVRSPIGSKRFALERLNVFTEREEYRRRGGLFSRKQTIWQTGLEDRDERVVLHSCGSSSAATAVAAKIRNSLGLGLHDPWMRR
jgi:hypothetical protein